MRRETSACSTVIPLYTAQEGVNTPIMPGFLGMNYHDVGVPPFVVERILERSRDCFLLDMPLWLQRCGSCVKSGRGSSRGDQPELEFLEMVMLITRAAGASPKEMRTYLASPASMRQRSTLLESI